MTGGSELAWTDAIWTFVKVGLVLIFLSGMVWQFRHRRK
mgnify:CR=1 FL=1|jgi:hypothetical protein